MEAEGESYAKEHGVRNRGFYERNLLTRWGRIEGLRVPRTREGDFYPSLLQPYSNALGDILFELYAGLEATLSPTSLSRLTEKPSTSLWAWRRIHPQESLELAKDLRRVYKVRSKAEKALEAVLEKLRLPRGALDLPLHHQPS